MPWARSSIVDVRVVDDLAGQVDGAIGKPRARLVRVVHGAVHPVAEPEFTREMDGQPAGDVAGIGGLDALDQVAVIARGQHVRDFVLQVEAFAEDQGWTSDEIHSVIRDSEKITRCLFSIHR